ncbi:helix-hairpin-helix domain-containing protein [Bacillus sp. AK128]
MFFERRKWIIISISILLIILALFSTLNGNSNQEEEYLNWEQSSIIPPEEPEEETEHIEEVKDVTMFVDIKGEVMSPGVYEVEDSSRVKDIIMLAGGFTMNADKNSVNLAQKVTDEMVIYVPTEGEVQTIWTTPISNQTADQQLVNINKAEQAELETLPGIGPAKAAAIIAYRNEHGLFKTVDDLGSVSGIGEKSLEKLKDFITIK